MAVRRAAAVLLVATSGCGTSDAAAPAVDSRALGPPASATDVPAKSPAGATTSPPPSSSVPPSRPPADLCALPRTPDPVAPGRPPPIVITDGGTSLGFTAFSANGRIQPRGVPTTYFFEYGPTPSYGSKTAVKSLGPRRSAFYRESWDGGLAGWRGGGGTELVFSPSGGVGGGFVRFTEPSGIDYNHVDGIGLLHLVQYFYPGYYDNDAPTAALGGADPDLRDAKVRVSVRGNAWIPRGTELIWWSQGDVTHGRPPPDRDPAYSNWAHTGHSLTEHLASGDWETAEYQLENDTHAWTFAGANAQYPRPEYVYEPLDEVLRHNDVDFFHLLAFIDDAVFPSGSIDFDDFEIAYRNHSVLRASNGGRLVSATQGSDDPSPLTDGWRNGPGHTWRSVMFPPTAPEIVYAFERPVMIDRIQLHQNPEFPTKIVEVLVSQDGTRWTDVWSATLPATTPRGPNFAYALTRDLGACATLIKVRLSEGYRIDAWGLGEIEVFGSGAVMLPDDDVYHVNDDIKGLAQGATVHYRLIATSAGRRFEGPDMTFQLPSTTSPEVATGAASRIAGGTAKLEGRMNSLGHEANVFFEYGPDTTYGATTTPRRTGAEITPRTVVATLEGLVAGALVHYRLVASGTNGTTYGADQTFVAR